ncbi:unnamed protein product [Spodoptera littoralis]|uniref:Uncharacterized protein n=1 Tax=Spodoptera littoralis TaxID=7109 RepID=A0A9P0ICM5_SPOLI|nr:unnamed protein product [Spodoptera littoralis]CAH1644337.1 unnamed protein product [Spodoptera littoralis]
MKMRVDEKLFMKTIFTSRVDKECETELVSLRNRKRAVFRRQRRRSWVHDPCCTTTCILIIYICFYRPDPILSVIYNKTNGYGNKTEMLFSSVCGIDFIIVSLDRNCMNKYSN